jgi:hypothetical protein
VTSPPTKERENQWAALSQNEDSTALLHSADRFRPRLCALQTCKHSRTRILGERDPIRYAVFVGSGLTHRVDALSLDRRIRPAQAGGLNFVGRSDVAPSDRPSRFTGHALLLQEKPVFSRVRLVLGPGLQASHIDPSLFCRQSIFSYNAWSLSYGIWLYHYL